MKFIGNTWRDRWQLLTVKLSAFLSAFFALVILFSEQILQVWNAVPDEIKSKIPQDWMAWIGLAVSIAMMFARLKKQNIDHQALGFVTITAGHSNSDPGAVANGFLEAELCAKFRNAVAKYLRDEGLVVKTDGVGVENQPLSQAIKLISKSSTAIEFHMNAASSKQANGIETISLPKNRILAQKLSIAVADVFGSRLRGRNGWIDQSQSARGKLGFVSNGGLIVELGFISNEHELNQFNQKYWLAAKAVARVIIEHEKALI